MYKHVDGCFMKHDFSLQSFYKLRLQAKEVAGRLEFWAKSLKIIEGTCFVLS